MQQTPPIRLNPVCRTCNITDALYPRSCPKSAWCFSNGPQKQAAEARRASKRVQGDQAVRWRRQYPEED